MLPNILRFSEGECVQRNFLRTLLPTSYMLMLECIHFLSQAAYHLFAFEITVNNNFTGSCFFPFSFALIVSHTL